MTLSVKSILTYFTLLDVCIFILFRGLAKAQAFLAPLAVAVLLAMISLSLARCFEKKESTEDGLLSFQV